MQRHFAVLSREHTSVKGIFEDSDYAGRFFTGWIKVFFYIKIRADDFSTS